MASTRRQFLATLSAGAAVGGLSSSNAATDTTRVFLHPADGNPRTVIDALHVQGGEVLFEFDNFEFIVGRVPTPALDTLASMSSVARVEEDDTIHATQIFDDDSGLGDGIGIGDDPNDDDEGDSGDSPSSCTHHPVQTPSWGWERIGADLPEETGDGVDVAILDTGIASTHCDLSVAGGRNFTVSGGASDYEDRQGHGTHCAGIVGALDNDSGTVGVAPDVNLYAVKVLGDDGSGMHSWMAAGIDWCISNDIELLSMSFGGGTRSHTMDQVIEKAHSAGHLLIGSAGNEGNNGADACNESNVTYPATHENVIAVSAMNQNDTLASYSSVGDAVELMAPGTRIYSTTPGNNHGRKSGTSMAAPFVTGVAGLAWEAHEQSGPGPNTEIRSVLATSAEPVLDSCAEGHGLIDAGAAVDAEPDPNHEPDNGEGSSDSDADGADGTSEPGTSPFDKDSIDGFVETINAVLERIQDIISTILNAVF